MPYPPTGRQAWADNIRVWIIIGVITTHVATAYLIERDWYYMERTAGAAAEMVAWSTVGVGALSAWGCCSSSPGCSRYAL